MLSATSDKVVVQVDTLESGSSANSMNLFLAVGIPEGYEELLPGITFEPKLLSLSTNVVSAGGSLITAVVKGVGVKDNVTLVDSATSEDLC